MYKIIIYFHAKFLLYYQSTYHTTNNPPPPPPHQPFPHTNPFLLQYSSGAIRLQHLKNLTRTSVHMHVCLYPKNFEMLLYITLVHYFHLVRPFERIFEKFVRIQGLLSRWSYMQANRKSKFIKSSFLLYLIVSIFLGMLEDIQKAANNGNITKIPSGIYFGF